MSERKRFTRVEMERVVADRNQYKQRLLELQEALHRHDALRASRQEQSSTMGSSNDGSLDHPHNKKRTTFWKL